MQIANLDLKLRIGYEMYIALRNYGNIICEDYKDLRRLAEESLGVYLDMLPVSDNNVIRARVTSRMLHKEDIFVPSLKLLD